MRAKDGKLDNNRIILVFFCGFFFFFVVSFVCGIEADAG